MRKLKEFCEWYVASLIVGFVGSSFVIGIIWIISNIVEKICSILGV